MEHPAEGVHEYRITHAIDMEPAGETVWSNGVKRTVEYLEDGTKVVTWDSTGFWARYSREAAKETTASPLDSITASAFALVTGPSKEG